jgi:hypothetical protein
MPQKVTLSPAQTCPSLLHPMKRIFSELFGRLEKLGNLVLKSVTTGRRAALKAEASERQANEAERLDRLRNPSDYRGR